jgi:ribulose kinase
LFETLNSRLEALRKQKGLAAIDYLTIDYHVQPDFHGNRSPIADPSIVGMISGLTLDDSMDELAILYLATVQGLAYGTKHILEDMAKKGVSIKCIIACGGLVQNQLFTNQHAQALQLPVLIPHVISEAVPLGAAITSAKASGSFPTLESAMKAMNRIQATVEPNPELAGYHEKKFKVFLEMYQDLKKYRSIMEFK